MLAEGRVDCLWKSRITNSAHRNEGQGTVGKPSTIFRNACGRDSLSVMVFSFGFRPIVRRRRKLCMANISLSIRMSPSEIVGVILEIASRTIELDVFRHVHAGALGCVRESFTQSVPQKVSLIFFISEAISGRKFFGTFVRFAGVYPEEKCRRT